MVLVHTLACRSDFAKALLSRDCDRQFGESCVTWRTVAWISDACVQRPPLLRYALLLLAFHSVKGQEKALDLLESVRGGKTDRNIHYLIDAQVADLVPWAGKPPVV